MSKLKRFLQSGGLDAGGGWIAAPGTFRWDGEFADPLLESRYRDASHDHLVRRTRAAFVLGFFFALAGIVDYFDFAGTIHFPIATSLRVLTLIASGSALILITRGANYSIFFGMLTVAELLIFLTFNYTVYFDAQNDDDDRVGAVVILLTFYLAIPNRLKLNIAQAVFSSGVFLWIFAVRPDISMSTIIGMGVILCVVNVFGIFLVRNFNELRRGAYAAVQQEKNLNKQLQEQIDSREEAEQAARMSDANFHALFQVAPIPLILVAKRSGDVLQLNQAARDLFGIPASETRMLNVRHLITDETLRSQVTQFVQETDKSEAQEINVKRGNGEDLWISMAASKLTYQEEEAFLFGALDVTERRREAAMLRQARDEATAANRAKSEFLANMSHELRTPLNAIIGFSEALEQQLFGQIGDPRYIEYSKDIHMSGKHLLNLINDILDLSKIEARQFEIYDETFALTDLFETTNRLVSHRASENLINLVTDLPEQEITISADERAMRQVLINIVANAVKFSEVGGEVKVCGHIVDGAIEIKIIDNGIGMAPKDIPKALEPFSQVDGSLTRNHEGTGLGLPLAKRLVELHGGTLEVESNLGEGTTVSITLPPERLMRSNTAQDIAKDTA